MIAKVDHSGCGTLPDTGNFRIKAGETYDSYRGVKKLMKWAKGVSIKDMVWDDPDHSTKMDFEWMLNIVLDAGYRGYCGIDYGGFAGLNASRQRIESAVENLTS